MKFMLSLLGGMAMLFGSHQAPALPLKQASVQIKGEQIANILKITPSERKGSILLVKRWDRNGQIWTVTTSRHLGIKFVSSTVLKIPPTAPVQNTAAKISATGVFDETNAARISNGLPDLTSNEKLNAIAMDRLNDMVDNNYFAHESPTGKTASALTSVYGYRFHYLGENIIEGNTFSTSYDIVNAWMNSPGHRANILSKNYDEIGIAVEQRLINGRKQWIGVQVFGSQL